MLSVDIALSLRDAGLAWRPAPGDRFVVLQPELLGQPFVLSDMTVDLHEFPGGSVVGFNGTTEWALDSVDVDQTVWVPHEHQLREHLGADFVRLTRTAEGYSVTLADGSVHDGDDPERAYATALLRQLSAGGVNSPADGTSL